MKNQSFIRRKKRVRNKITGTKERPRLTLYRSNKHLFAQIIDDESQKTLIGISDKIIKEKVKNSDKALVLGEKIAKMALEKKIKEIVFDRSGYQYVGKIKAFAEGARKAGLKF